MMDTVVPARIDADGIYSDGDVRLLLGLTSAALTRARGDGSLRYSRHGHAVLYRGQWLVDWLEQDADRRSEQHSATDTESDVCDD